MSDIDAVVESEEVEAPAEAVESSSDDLRSALQSAAKEVAERQRDEQGRFAAKQEQAAQDVEQPAAAQAAAPAVAPAEPAQAVRPPDAWSPTLKAKFATLPPDVQAELVAREADVHKGFTKQDEQRQLGKQFSDVVTPYLPIIRAEGGNPVAAVQDLLQTAYTLRTAPPQQKSELFVRLAQQFGVDMQQVFNRLTGQQPQVNPQVAQMQQQLAQLQQERYLAQQAREQEEQAQIHQTIDSFASDPKNVYFANVKAEVAALLSNGNAKDLQEAYNMACWARPDIRTILLQQQEQQKRADAQAKANKARLAGSSVSGSPSGAGSAPGALDPNASLRETIRAAMRDQASSI